MRLKLVDPRQRSIDNHAQFRLIWTLWPSMALFVECTDGEPILAVAFRPVIESFNIRLRLADLLPACAAIFGHKQPHRPGSPRLGGRSPLVRNQKQMLL